jgi:hypothetical protein
MSSRKILLSHPTGNANVRAILMGLLKENSLASFHTTIASFPGNGFEILSRMAPFKEFKRREFDNRLRNNTKTYPNKEIFRLISSKLGFKKLTKHESGVFSIDSVYKNFDKLVSKSLDKDGVVTGVYCYEDGALETFKAAKKQGLTCIYDLPIAYWETGRTLMQAEAERLPEWAVTLGGGIKDSFEKLARKTEEMQLADTVVVPSTFVRDSLPNFNGIEKRCILSPFGSPTFNKKHNERIANIDKPLRVLFVGSMGQRKGLADLFEAVKLVNTDHLELIVMGALQAPLEFYKRIFSNFKYEHGRSHAEVLRLMQSCDVFCLPSIVEGRALVMQEAMSQGLPIIITKNTGGEDLVIEGSTGFLVPTSTPAAIAEKLAWCLENRALVYEMGQRAQIHAASYTWDSYSSDIINKLVQ